MARPAGGSDHAASIHRTGERFDRLLRAQGVSLDSLAKRVRLQKSTLENFRAGHRKLPEDVLDAVARELGTSANYLMDRSDDDRPMAVLHAEAAAIREQAAARALGQDKRR